MWVHMWALKLVRFLVYVTKGNTESDTSWLDSYISDKQDSNVLTLADSRTDTDSDSFVVLRYRAGDERLHTDSRSINTRFR